MSVSLNLKKLFQKKRKIHTRELIVAVDRQDKTIPVGVKVAFVIKDPLIIIKHIEGDFFSYEADEVEAECYATLERQYL